MRLKHLKHRQRHCLFNNLFKVRAKKSWKVRITEPLWGGRTVIGRLPSQSASDAENIYVDSRILLSSCHDVFCVLQRQCLSSSTCLTRHRSRRITWGLPYARSSGSTFITWARTSNIPWPMSRKSVGKKSSGGWYYSMSIASVAYSLFTRRGGMTVMTSSIKKRIRITGLLRAQFTDHRWIPRTKASDAELSCLLWSVPEPALGQTMEMPVIWDAIALITTSL